MHASPRFLLRAAERLAVLVHAQTLILIEELAAQEPARILRNAAQPLLGGLLRRPVLHVLRRIRRLRLLVGRVLGGLLLFGVLVFRRLRVVALVAAIAV